MNDERTVAKPQKRKPLPYITEDELNAEIPAIKIQVTGTYFKRGQHQNDNYEAPYETQIIVPKKYNLGHVKLQTTRKIKTDPELNGIRVRTFYVDGDFVPEPVKDKKYKVRDFMSDQSIQENQMNKQMYMERKKLREAREDDEDGTPPQFSVSSSIREDHGYSV